QRRHVADRTWVRIVPKARELDPMGLVAQQRKRIHRRDMSEEVPLSGRDIVACLALERGTKIGTILNDARVRQQRVDLRGPGFAHLPIFGGIRELRYWR